MDDPAIIAAAIVLVLSSLGGTIVLVINAVAAARDRSEAAQERRENREATVAVAKKADVIIDSTTKIHELTNSTNSNLQKALELMTEKVAGLERINSELREAKRDTAAVQAMTDQRNQSQVAAVLASAAPQAQHKAAASSPPPPGTTADDPVHVKVEDQEPVKVEQISKQPKG